MRALFCLLLLGLLEIALAQSCPQPYIRYTKDHTYCRQPNKSCKLSDNTVTKAQQEEIVRAHNDLRRKVANGKESTGNLPSASNMLEVQWDDELAELAKRWAAQCIDDHDCPECRRTKDYKVGQNIAGSKSPSSSPTADWTSMVKYWYSEVQFFDSSMIDKYVHITGPKTVGHFTQVVWANSWRVGCGYAVFPAADGDTQQLYVCNYGPAGNTKEEPVYEKGNACRKCPKNTECNDGLCQVKKGSIPITERPAGNYLYYCDFTDVEACNIKQVSGKKPWTITKTLAGGYIGIVLENGEESEFSIGTTMKKVSKSCMVFYYRKGPNVAGEESDSQGQIPLRIGGKIVHRFPIDGDSADDMKYSLGNPMSYAYQVGAEFKANKGTQYLEFSKIYIIEGDC